MKQEFYSMHIDDYNGNPGGGTANAMGVTVVWQNGPLGRGDLKREPNGAFVETLLAIAHDRLAYYQGGTFNCAENAQAMTYIEEALNILDSRTKDRKKREVEGTHVK